MPKKTAANERICDACGFDLDKSKTKVAGSGKNGTTVVASRPMPETRVQKETGFPGVSRDVSGKDRAGITKVYVESTGERTKVADTYAMKATSVFGKEEALKPLYGWLIVIQGREKWRQFVIPDEERRHVLGSSADCAICLAEEGVEPRHASLRLKDGKLFITDLDSSTGTQVGNETVVKVELQDGDEISLGTAKLKFRRL